MRDSKRLAALFMVFCIALPLGATEEIERKESAFRPGDKVKILIWRQEDITGEYQLDFDGELRLPLVGKVPAQGLTADALTDTLVSRYSAFIKNPMIMVTPRFRVTILGAVKMPGSYWVSGAENVTDLIAMAGGLAEKAAMERTKVTRGNKVIVVNAAQYIRTGKTLDDIGIQSGDIVVVPRSRWPNWSELAVILSTVALGWSLYNSIKD
jgi:protein involved in polysaccharide export with SLBB domain